MSQEADLRADAMACLRAAVAAVEPERLTADFLRQHPELVAGPGRLAIVAIGKAAAAMARGAVKGLDGRGDLTGVLIAPQGEVAGLGEALTSEGLFAPGAVEIFGGGHPIPNLEGARGAQSIRTLAGKLDKDDTLLCLISGGGSALMTLPPDGITLVDVQSTTEALLRAGATIQQLNGVRKHLDLLKGGRLAQQATPARVLGLVLSDVVGDPLDVIASGPVTADPTTFDDAVDTLQRFAVWDSAPIAVREYLERGQQGREPESPKTGAACFDRVEAHVIGSNRLAAEAARVEAERRGYTSQVVTTRLTGEAREVGRQLALIGQDIYGNDQPQGAPTCLIAAGETTVTVRGAGRGGRNQEVALGAAVALDEGDLEVAVLVASMGTDGIDGPTDAAGAWATPMTVRRGAERSVNAGQALADNDAYGFFEVVDGLIITGATGTNVMDVALVLVGGSG